MRSSVRWALVVIVVAVIAGTAILISNLFSRQQTGFVGDEALQTVFRSSEHTFLFSRSSPLREGDQFPVLDLPVVAGQMPDWTQPMVVTLGTAASSSAADLYSALDGVPIQKVHILSSGTPGSSSLDSLPPDVTVLDSTGDLVGFANYVSPGLNSSLGVYRSTSAYLIGEDRLILYAHLNHGDFAVLADNVPIFVESGPDAVVPSEQVVLEVNQQLPLEVLPTDVQAGVMTELMKTRTVVFVLDEEACSSCSGFMDRLQPYLVSWVEAGYGVLVVDSGPHSSYRVEMLEPGGILLYDTRDSPGTSSELVASWGVVTLPGALILADGRYQGTYPYAEIEINGTQVRDAQFRGIDSLLRNQWNELVGESP